MKKLVFVWMVCGLAMTSCLSPKVIYLKDMEPDFLYSLIEKTELKIKQEDRLRITISSKNPELSAPFNLGVFGYQVNVDGEVRTTASPVMQESGYEVDPQGNIEFPVLGTLHVEGLTRQELSGFIKTRLREDGLINDVIVTVDFLNLKIMMMGEVGGVGILSVPEGRITLLEAIMRSGGLTPNASLGEVAVIREQDNGRVMLMNDLRTVEVFNSPSFYLQQNDIVYVKPKAGRPSEGEQRAWQLWSILLSLAGTSATILLLIQYYQR
ncbi:MAG: polysaccharide biosynthesis/export family protein [Dysgonamonadaceae bacterium]|nr:polysaccharide biosynthesis/export family protein [Dysgonamonadaceae bacterium]